MSFDLSALVREVHDTTNLTDHRQVAKEVQARIPDEHINDALLETLTEYVRVKFTLLRTSIGIPQQPGKSWKRDALRAWWQREQNQRYATADGQKLLRDFTTADCLFQAELLRKKAAENITKAEQWEDLAGLLKPGKTVRDLKAAA